MKPSQIGVTVRCITVLMVLAGWMPDAAAQPGRGGPQLAPEKAEAARKLQADCVAKELGLSEKSAEGLVDAYKAARTTYDAGVRELSAEQGGDRMGRFQAFRELQEEERGKLEEALKGFLKPEQVGQALTSLGTFSRQWDRYADTLGGFGLEDGKLYPALDLTCKYVIASDKARREAMASMDFQSMRGATQELKAKLDAGLAEILSEEQLAKWKTATAGRGRGGPGGGGPRGGGPGGGGPGPR